jgi:bifunctional non-homologous end joining protein LigD
MTVKSDGLIAKMPIDISHPRKIFWPEEGYTKLALAEYYAHVFRKLQPYVKGHMMTLERCPDGVNGECFYQKEMPRGMPEGTPSKRIENVKSKRRFTTYVVGGSLATQLALVNFGCIAVHVMSSRAHTMRQPEWMCFDLDPESGEFADAARAGLHVKEALDTLKLVSFAKTSGGRGMHVLVPIRKGPDADEVLSFSKEVIRRVTAAYPDELTVEHSIAARYGRVYLDPFRNAMGQTVVAPYSVRRKAKAPISTPLKWSEVKPSLVPSNFNLGNFAKWFGGRDPWNDFFAIRQTLRDAVRWLRAL